MVDSESGRGGNLGPHPSRARTAADLVFQRIIGQRDGALGADPAGQELGPALDVRASVARSTDLLADLLERSLDGFTARLSQRTAAGGAGGFPAGIELVGRPATHAATTVWIHNLSGLAAPEFRIRLTDLSAADGHLVGALRLSVNPDSFGPSSQVRRSAALTVDVPADARAGLYHGYLLAQGLPEATVPVRLTVQ